MIDVIDAIVEIDLLSDWYLVLDIDEMDHRGGEILNQALEIPIRI